MKPHFVSIKLFTASSLRSVPPAGMANAETPVATCLKWSHTGGSFASDMRKRSSYKLLEAKAKLETLN